jgi:A/G-specific adenine glycosylase
VSSNSKLKNQNSKLQRLTGLLLDWFADNARDLPWRRTRDPYAIWVSEIMLQQTQVKTVMPYWKRWMRELPTIKAIAKASPDKIHKLWEGLGYYTRARNLQKAAREIMEKHGGKFPDNFDEVLALPGIGRYTAGAVCSIAFNQPVPILDGNVIRVLTRIFGIGKNPREKKTNAQLWDLAEELVSHAKTPSSQRRINPKNFAAFAPLREAKSCSLFNQSLMELGALICTPHNPQCQICPVKRLCVAFRKNRVNEFPNLGKRPTTTARHFIAFIVERNGRFFARQRPAGVVNAHLWEFPNVECNGANAKNAFKSIFGVRPPGLEPLCTIRHSITRYRITLEAFSVKFGGSSSARPKNSKMGRRRTPPSEVGIWRTRAQLQQLAFSSAHKKILVRLHSPKVWDATPETTGGTPMPP